MGIDDGQSLQKIIILRGLISFENKLVNKAVKRKLKISRDMIVRYLAAILDKQLKILAFIKVWGKKANDL